jgi:hypothetical protein
MAVKISDLWSLGFPLCYIVLMSDKQSSVLEVEKGSVEGTIEKVPEDDGIDPVAEQKLVKKLDWIFLPLFTVICRSRISWILPSP